MTNQDRLFDVELFQGRVQHFRLHVDGDGTMIRAITMTMTRPIKSEGAVICSQWPVQVGPVLTGTRIAMNQNHRTAGALDYKMQPGIVNRNEFREGLRIIVSNSGGEVSLLESSCNVHALRTLCVLLSTEAADETS